MLLGFHENFFYLDIAKMRQAINISMHFTYFQRTHTIQIVLYSGYGREIVPQVQPSVHNVYLISTGHKKRAAVSSHYSKRLPSFCYMLFTEFPCLPTFRRATPLPT